ncbi:MFS transporter [Desulfosporosinus fructosivorans]|uniref:MFS transporter n=1 Tax=Desulfosporosinus fructosivorans TaxID=2018669 RepID=A0A4Z0QZV4_9FIRM|nr:MFS transporter [Desulfosporosinus fructosivorans]TGE35267.1 MFS transporter [Desulfosporosinus fructosivorans]
MKPFALCYNNFRVYAIGSLITRVGDWMDLVALNWAVLQLTGSAFYLGLISACRLLPVFTMSVPAGALADRYNKRKLLLRLETGYMFFTITLALLLMYSGPFWLFALIVTLRSVFSTMGLTVRNAFIPSLVPPVALASAIALNATFANLSGIVGPALAGFLLTFVEPVSIFRISAITSLAVIGSLFWVRPMATLPEQKCHENTGIMEAINFIRSNSVVKSLLILAIVPMLFGFPYTSMMPIFSKELLKVGPDGLGILLGASGAGALTASASLSWLNVKNNHGKILVVSSIGFGIGLVLFALTRRMELALMAMYGVGLLGQTYRTMSRITLQHAVPDHLIGRVLGIALMDRGFIAIGAIFVGWLASYAGSFVAALFMGLGCALITLIIVLLNRNILRL